MTDEITTQFKTEGQPAFPVADKGNDNPSDPSSVDTTKETATDQPGAPDQDKDKIEADDKKIEGDAGLADHPRWKERETDWTNRFNDQEKRHVGEIAKLREEFEAKIAELGPKQPADDTIESLEIPPWFNGDEQQWKDFLDWNEKQVISKAKEMSVKEIESKSTAEKKAIDDATQYFNDEVTAIEADKELNPNSLKVDRNKLLKTALDNELVDTQGRWNYKAAFKLMKPSEIFQAKEALNDRKNLAGAITSDTKGDAKPQPYKTSADFSKPGERPW